MKIQPSSIYYTSNINNSNNGNNPNRARNNQSLPNRKHPYSKYQQEQNKSREFKNYPLAQSSQMFPKTRPVKPLYEERGDYFTPSAANSDLASKIIVAASSAMAALMVVGSAFVFLANDDKKNEENVDIIPDTAYSATVPVDTQEPEIPLIPEKSIPYEEVLNQMALSVSTLKCDVPEKTLDTESAVNETVKEENIQEKTENTMSPAAQNLYDDIYKLDQFADTRIENLVESFGMPKEEIMEYIVQMCIDPKFGNNCVEPILFYALLAGESNCISTQKGDLNKSTGEYRAWGFGQTHKITVDEVNNRIKMGSFGKHTYNNGKPYTYEDRLDAKKNIEITLLFLRHCHKLAKGCTDTMLATYNTGNPSGVNTVKGQNYIAHIYSQITPPVVS